MNNTDFTKGVDLTGINPATAADINNLVDLAVPEKDTAENVGKSLNLVTTDSALNTPDVPNANTTIKWKRYQWIRRSFDGSVKPKAYLWDDNKTNDITLLKWYEISVDLTALQADIDSAIATATNAETIAGAVATTAASAVTSANTAITTANGAVVTANTAIANAATANAAAVNAQATADNALISANTALAVRAPASVLTPGTAYQELRTNAGASAPEWFSRKNNIAILQETAALNTNSTWAGGASRLTNTEFSDPGNLVSLVVGGTANQIRFATSGRYHITVNFPWYLTGTGSAGALKASIQFTEQNGSGKYLQGNSYGLATIVAGANDRALPNLIIDGYLDILAGEQYIVTCSMTLTNITVAGGIASNGAGLPNEIYMQIIAELIG